MIVCHFELLDFSHALRTACRSGDRRKLYPGTFSTFSPYPPFILLMTVGFRKTHDHRQVFLSSISESAIGDRDHNYSTTMSEMTILWKRTSSPSGIGTSEV
jgi:hypothetical protein